MLSAVAPYYFDYTFKQIKEYFHSIAHATSLNLMIYNAAQARSYSLEEMKELLLDEKITSVKYTGDNFFFLERLIDEYPNKKFYTGADDCFLAGQAVGAHGAIGTTFNYYAEKYIQAKEFFHNGKFQDALAVIKKVNGLTELMFEADSMLASTKYLMTLQGLDIAPISRPPFDYVTDEFKSKLREYYENNK